MDKTLRRRNETLIWKENVVHADPPPCLPLTGMEEQDAKSLWRKKANNTMRGCLRCCIIHDRRAMLRTRVTMVVMASCVLFCVALLFNSLIPKLIPGPHSVFDDIFWRAVWLMPFSYLKIHWWDELPTTAQHLYELTNDNTFVINLDSDTHRLDHFRQKNHGQGTRFSATELSMERLQVDTALLNTIAEFPNVRQLVTLGRYGEAGVYISQIRLLKHIVELQLDHAFILEDDAFFVDKKSNNKTITQVEGPAPVDVLFLTAHISRATRLSVQGRSIIRVMGGSGAYGYLITRRGAQKLLTLLRKGSCGWFDRSDSCVKDALDIAMMKYGARYNLQIYLPIIDWPLVEHAYYLGSTKNHRDRSSVRASTTAKI